MENAQGSFLAAWLVRARREELAALAEEDEAFFVRRDRRRRVDRHEHFARLMGMGMNEREATAPAPFWGPGCSFGVTRRW